MNSRQDDELTTWLVKAGALSEADRSVMAALEARAGGGMDSVLLETGRVSEATLSDALAQVFGMPPLSPQTDLPPEPGAAGRLPGEVARRLLACPIRHRADGLVVVVRHPPSRQDVDELTSLLGGALYLVIAPEVRLHQALHLAYGWPLEPRWRALLSALQGTVAASWVERPSGGHGAERSNAWSLSRAEVTRQLEAATSRTAVCDTVLRAVGSRPACRAVVGVRERRVHGWGRAGDLHGLLFDTHLPQLQMGTDLERMFSRAAPLLGPPSSAEENQALYGWLGRGLPAFSGLCPIRVGGRLVGALYVDYPDAPSDFAEEAALAALVGSALERVVRERGSGASDEIPSTEATEADALLFGTSTPEQGTTPAVQCEPPPRDTSPSPQEQGLREQDGSPKPLLALEAEPEPWASLADELGATIPIERPDGDEKTRIGDVEALVAQLSSDSLDDVEDATTALIAQGTSALPALKAAFPGRLLHDSFSLRQIPRTAAHLGPLIEVMAALGHEGVTACLPFLDAKDREQRFAATYLFRACPDARAIQFLRHRLNDPEPLVSELAASALAPFVEHPEFREVLEHYRRRLVGATVEGRTRAAWLLGEFRDVASVPQLIAALRDRAEVANAAHLALTKVTLQDLGFEASGWIAWWKVGKRRCRVEWLLDGLVSPEFDLRELAGRELTLLAGTDHGYHGDDPLPRREEATQQFMHWWERTRESHHDEV